MKIVSFEKKIFPLRKKFFNSLCQLEVEQSFSSDFQEGLQKESLGVVSFLLDEEQVLPAISYFKGLPNEISMTLSCDVILFENNKWWPRNIFAQALREALVLKSPKLDTQGFGYVTGVGGLARTSIAVLTQMGFSKINWVVEDEEESKVEEFHKKLKKIYFGLSLQLIKSSALTLQPNNGTVLINTIPAIERPILIENLSYLNFIKKGGVVVDTTVLPLQNSLTIEAEQVGIHVIGGYFLEGLRDHLWLSKLLGDKFSISDTNYLNKWQEFLKTRPTSS